MAARAAQCFAEGWQLYVEALFIGTVAACAARRLQSMHCLPLAQQRLPSGVTNKVLPAPLRTTSPHAMQRPLPQQSQQLTQSSAHDYITHLPLLLLVLFHMAQAMAPLPAHAPPWRRRRSAVG